MKKIQLSTVEQTAQVQVININSYLVAKSVRIMLSMKHAIEGTRTQEMVTSDDGDGRARVVPSVTEDGEPDYKYNLHRFTSDSIDVLHDDVLPFLEELCNAFEEAG